MELSNNFTELCANTVQQSASEQIQNLTHSLEKSQQENQFLKGKIGFLEKEISYQKEIIDLMKRQK